MSEKDAHFLLEKTLLDSKIEKKWHPSKLRMGKNTTLNFRDESSETLLKDEDIYFIDIGPVYFNHEGDFGETFVIGDNPRLKNLANSSKTIFQKTMNAWKTHGLTGQDLYEFAAIEARKLNLKLNSNMYGHRLGDFPHAIHSKAKLGELSFSPAPNLWVLEIHVIDEEIERGAFYENILI
jgi:Xaa-Pro aminopeptidase